MKLANWPTEFSAREAAARLGGGILASTRTRWRHGAQGRLSSVGWPKPLQPHLAQGSVNLHVLLQPKQNGAQKTEKDSIHSRGQSLRARDIARDGAFWPGTSEDSFETSIRAMSDERRGFHP